MAAYGAASSLKNTILRFLESSRISLVSRSPQIFRPAYNAMIRLQRNLLQLDKTGCSKVRTKVNDLDERIKEAIWEFEDLLESHAYEQILPQLESSSCRGERDHLSFSVDLQLESSSGDERDHFSSAQILPQLESSSSRGERDHLSFSVDLQLESSSGDESDHWSFDQIRPQLESSLGDETDHLVFDSSSGDETDHSSFKTEQLPFFVDLQSLQHCVDYLLERVSVMEAEYDVELSNMPEEEGEPISSRIDFGGINSTMVGLSDEFEETRDFLLVEDERNWLLVSGMAGVGKTAFAKKVFDDPLIKRHFEFRAWVKVGRKCEFSETLQCILAQLDTNTRYQMLTQRQDDDDDDDDEKLVALLEERLNDKKCLIVLDDVWEWDTRLMLSLPKENVRILLTSRLRIKASPVQVVRLLNKEESKKLLGEKLFGEEGFPPHLVKLGEKIANKCEGLPLMIVTVAELLSKEDMTLEYWTEVARKQHCSVFVDAYNQISEVLYPSYDYLPQHLKMLFLYLGIFPPYSDIEPHNLLERLRAEGFIEMNAKQTLEDVIMDCTSKLACWYHLVILQSNEKSWFSMNVFRVHSCWQHFCKKESSKIKFLHVLQSCDEDIRDQRRLCSHCNTLFAFEQVCDSIKRDCASIARSLLCFGPDHQYPVPIHAMDFKLLRVLDARKVRFYHVLLEILKLVYLKYLALTCNKELPISISNLFHLQTLIVYPHMYIKKREAQSNMPVEIWDMQELQHIEVLGRDLPASNSDATLDKLSSLLGVSVKSCTREILKRIPNLKSLLIWIELKPYDDDDGSNPLSGLVYISEELHDLTTLTCIVMNPEMKYEFMCPLSMFSSSLTRLALNGLGCPWKHMNDIGSLLPNLVDLELQHYAFRGPEWDIEPWSFLKLEKVVITDTDLVRWRAHHGSLPRLDLLSIRHCYKLQHFDWIRDPSMVPTAIELIECNPLAAISATELKPESLFRVRCAFSFLR